MAEQNYQTPIELPGFVISAYCEGIAVETIEEHTGIPAEDIRNYFEKYRESLEIKAE